MINKSNLLALLKQKVATILLSGLLVGALSSLFLILNEKNFKVTTDFLVVQNQSGSQDIYTLSKSAEYVGKILSEGMYSELFIDEVAKTGKVNKEFLPFDKKEKLKQWSKIVRASRNELGIVNIEVFDNNQKDALAISQGIAEVLVEKNNLFRGEDQNIAVKILSGPVQEKNPSVTNIILTVIAGFVFGVFVSLMWIYYKSVNSAKEVSFNMKNASTLVFPFAGEPTKERMENSGIFMSDEEYRESLEYLEK